MPITPPPFEDELIINTHLYNGSFEKFIFLNKHVINVKTISYIRLMHDSSSESYLHFKTTSDAYNTRNMPTKKAQSILEDIQLFIRSNEDKNVLEIAI